jgi:hypothetical protein
MNTAQKFASSKPDRDMVSMPKARGGWTLFIVIGAVALFFYWKPDAVPSTFTQLKEWVLSQQRDLFSEGGGYGELPKGVQ